jgi:hypothetical protein
MQKIRGIDSGMRKAESYQNQKGMGYNSSTIETETPTQIKSKPISKSIMSYQFFCNCLKR